METSTIKALLENVLPKNTYITVSEYSIMGCNRIKIMFASKDYLIHNVAGQRPDVVSLSLDLKTLELKPQVFGGCGGQSIYRKPNLNDAKEKYLAMKSIRIPFRTPKNNETAVLNAIKSFAQRWVLALKENKDILQYQNIVDYNEFLK